MYTLHENVYTSLLAWPPKSWPMVPKELDEEDWEEIEKRIARQDSWQMIADDYGVARSSLSRAGKSRGIKHQPGARPKRSLIPQGICSTEPQVRQVLSHIARTTGETDPESLLTKARVIFARGIDAVIDSIECDDDEKYDGLEDLGLGYSTADTKKFRRLSKRCVKEELGVRDMMSYTLGLAKIEIDRLQYHKPKLAAVTAAITTAVDPSTLTAAERKKRIAELESSLVVATQ